MRIAVSGSHGTGKSTLIAGFLAARPGYLHEAEAFEALADDIDLTDSEGPTAEGLEALLEHSISALLRHAAGASVVFERSPMDYLAYAAAARSSWEAGAAARFLDASVPRVREAARALDLIALVPLSKDIPPRPGESPRYRRRVDEALRRALLDDHYDLFGAPGSPQVVELPAAPDRRLPELIRLATAASRPR
jgi:hypothetical protein